MEKFLQTTTFEIRRYLFQNLPSLDTEWWRKHVIDRLSFKQQRIAQGRGAVKLDDLDFASLLSIFDQNWFELSAATSLTNSNLRTLPFLLYQDTCPQFCRERMT